MFRYGPPKGNDWRTLREELKLAYDVLRTKGGMMSDFERSEFQSEIQSRRDQYGRIIQAGQLEEFNAAVGSYKAAQQKAEKAHLAAVNRFDMGKLVAEMQALDFLVKMEIQRAKDGENISPNIEKIYTEAQKSGIPERQRAAAEVFKGAAPLFDVLPDFDTRVNSRVLATQARKDLEALRTTPELQQAEAELNTAAQAVWAQKVEVASTFETINGYSPETGAGNSELGISYKMIQNRNGQLVILDPNSIEVLGYSFEEIQTGPTPTEQAKG
jgi:hypothetical protein